MNLLSKSLFWIFAIGLGFVNPLITFGLIILYYLPRIIQDLCQTGKETCNENNHETDFSTEEFINYEENGKRFTVRKDQVPPKMNSFSDNTLEDMK